jgi:DNA-binding IclR family transcriptional regulator
LAFILAPNRSSSEKLSELCHLREVATMLSRGAPSADMNEAEAELDDLFAPRTQSVPAVERALSILEFLARSRHGVTLANLTRHLGVPKSTCHALLLTFQRCGYVQRDKKNGRYRFGMKLYELSNMALSGTSLRDQVAPFLYKLVEETKLTAHLAVLEQNGEAVLVDKIEASGAPQIATWIGKRMGLHCTAVGKAMIAHLSEPEMGRLISKCGLLRHNENTIGSQQRLRQVCETIRLQGYAVDDEEEEIGIRCVGAPIFNGKGEVIASLSVAGTTSQVEDLKAVACQVKDAALAVSLHLGFQPEQIATAPVEDRPDARLLRVSS